jgi:hypothetical protein
MFPMGYRTRTLVCTSLTLASTSADDARSLLHQLVVDKAAGREAALQSASALTQRFDVCLARRPAVGSLSPGQTLRTRLRRRRAGPNVENAAARADTERPLDDHAVDGFPFSSDLDGEPIVDAGTAIDMEGPTLGDIDGVAASPPPYARSYLVTPLLLPVHTARELDWTPPTALPIAPLTACTRRHLDRLSVSHARPFGSSHLLSPYHRVP